MKGLLCVSGLVLLPLAVNAGWLRTYGGAETDGGVFIRRTPDQTYIVIGSTKSFGEGKTDVWLLKVDTTGDTLWTQTYGDSADNYGYCVQPTADGGYILATSTGMIKTDQIGGIQWSNTLAGNGVVQTGDGGYVLLSQRNQNICLIKTNTAGDTVWTREIEAPFPSTGNSIRLASDGGYLIAGTLTEVGVLKPYLKQYALFFKTDSEGFTPPPGTGFEGESGTCGRAFCEGQDGDCFFGGVQVWDAATTEYLLLGCDSWIYCLWENQINYVEAYSIEPITDRGCVVSGAGWTVFSVDSSGEIAWSHDYGFTGSCVDLLSDGGFIVTGQYNGDVCILRTNTQGDTLDFIQEPPVTPVTPLTLLEIANPIGREIVLRYWDHPEGFRAQVFDASGRKVDEIHATGESGTITWGKKCYGAGVYFIVPNTNGAHASRVILIE